ncbi:MAG: hypothetical protein ACERLM_07150, partial [Acidimicrobiales bacterium]
MVDDLERRTAARMTMPMVTHETAIVSAPPVVADIPVSGSDPPPEVVGGLVVADVPVSGSDPPPEVVGGLVVATLSATITSATDV